MKTSLRIRTLMVRVSSRRVFKGSYGVSTIFTFYLQLVRGWRKDVGFGTNVGFVKVMGKERKGCASQSRCLDSSVVFRTLLKTSKIARVRR